MAPSGDVTDSSHAMSGRAEDVSEHRLRDIQPRQGQDGGTVGAGRHRDVQCPQQVNNKGRRRPPMMTHLARLFRRRTNRVPACRLTL